MRDFRLYVLPILLTVLLSSHGWGQAASPGPGDGPSPAASASATLDRKALEDYIRYLNLWGENVNVSLSEAKPSNTLPGYLEVNVTASVPGASLSQEYFVSPDGGRLVRGRTSDRLGKTVFRTGSYPFEAEQAALQLEGRPALGPEKAAVTVAVFSDFQCAYCREEGQMLRANLLQAYPDSVRMVFVHFPLVQIHDWAQPAAVAGHCLAAQSNHSFWRYHDWVFEAQPKLTAANFRASLQEWASGADVDPLRLQQCIQSPEANVAVSASMQQALAMGLNSTPTLFVNGRQVTGKLTWPGIKQIIDTELDFQMRQATRQQNNKEACCSVTLPGLFPQ
jgi:protein-disulfide isomerase